jgi:hypothetical protein
MTTEEEEEEPKEIENSDAPRDYKTELTEVVTEIEIDFQDEQGPVKILPLWELPGMKVMSIMALPPERRGTQILELLEQAITSPADRERLYNLTFGQLNNSIQEWLEVSSDSADD